MIKIENLNKNYKKIKVLDEINLEFEKSDVVVLMGPNASGKTTLLKSILGLVIPDEGNIFIKNINTKKNFMYRNFIGYMPQIANYPENLKVKELFNIVKDIRGAKKKTDEELVGLFKLEDVFETHFGKLSGGYKQRVTGAIAFLYNPEILILDEPTASLDPVSTEILKTKILKSKEEGKLIFVTSHTFSEVDELADRVVYLLEGKVIIDKTLREIKNGSGEIKFSEALKKYLTEID